MRSHCHHEIAADQEWKNAFFWWKLLVIIPELR